VRAVVEFITIPREGERENGDAALVRRWEGGLLIAVIDSLGHGEHAAQATAVGLGYLQEVSVKGGLRPVVEGLHEKLRGTRGAAAMLLLVEQHRLEGCGVGNVALRAYRARVPAMLTPGVLGAQLNRLHLFTADLAPGDRLVLFSDGITSRFDDEAQRRVPALETCRAIMERYRRTHDDATVLVIDIESDSEGS
jgi:negative regulator of sigma-B (phosphoserine phosphatase)